jgi:hypothetical protein
MILVHYSCNNNNPKQTNLNYPQMLTIKKQLISTNEETKYIYHHYRIRRIPGAPSRRAQTSNCGANSDLSGTKRTALS